MPRGDAFFRITDSFLAELYEESTVSIVTDINYFKLYNDIFGRKSGNRFLETIAGMVQDAAELEKFRQLLEKANGHSAEGGEGVVRFRKADGSVAEMNMRVYLLYTFDRHRLYLSMMG